MKVRRRYGISHPYSTLKRSRKSFKIRNNHRKCYIVGKKDSCTFLHGVDRHSSSTTNDYAGRRNLLKDKRIVSSLNQFRSEDDYIARYSYFLKYSKKRSYLHSLNNTFSGVNDVSQYQDQEELSSASFPQYPDFFNDEKVSGSNTHSDTMKFLDKTPTEHIESINSLISPLSLLSQVEKEWIVIKEYVSTTSRNCDHHIHDSFDILVARLAYDSVNRTSCRKDNNIAKNVFSSSIFSICSEQLSDNPYNNLSSNEIFTNFRSNFGKFSTTLQTFDAIAPYLSFKDLEVQSLDVDPIHMFKIFFSYYLDLLSNKTDQACIMDFVRSFCDVMVDIPQTYTLLNPYIFELLELFCCSLAHLTTMLNKCVISFFFEAIMYWTKQLLGIRKNSFVTLKPVIILYLFFSLINTDSEDNESLISLGLSLAVKILSCFIFQNFNEVLYVLLLFDVLFRVVSRLKFYIPDVITFLVDFISLYTSSSYFKKSFCVRFAKLQMYKVTIVDIPLPKRLGTQWIFPTHRINCDKFTSSVVLYIALFHLSTYFQDNHLIPYFFGKCPKVLSILIHLQSLEKLPRIFHECIEASLTLLSKPAICFNSFQLFKPTSKCIKFLILQNPQKANSLLQPIQHRKIYNFEYKTLLKNIRINSIISSNMSVNDEARKDRIRLERVNAIHQRIPNEYQ